MRIISVVSVFAFLFTIMAGVACDSIPGMGNAQQPIVQPVQGIQQVPVPMQPGVPGQVPQALPTVPGVQVPGMPAAVPGTPVAAQPAVPGVAAVPGLPVAAAIPVAAPIAPTPTGDLLTDRLNEVKFQQAADKTATSALAKVALATAKSQSYQVQLPGPPYCHAFVAVGDDAVKNVDLVIESPTAVPEAMDSTADNRAFIANHCPTIAGSYKLIVKMADGQGEVAVQVFSK
jgi:hypothetical protein